MEKYKIKDLWQLAKKYKKSSRMKFDGKLIKVTYDIADVNGNEAWREVVHHPGQLRL